MPKRKLPPLTPEEQSARFLQAVADLEAAGELRADADARFERTLQATRRSPDDDASRAALANEARVNHDCGKNGK